MISEETAIAIARAYKDLREMQRRANGLFPARSPSGPAITEFMIERSEAILKVAGELLALGINKAAAFDLLDHVLSSGLPGFFANQEQRLTAEIQRLSDIALAEIAAAGGGMVIYRKTLTLDENGIAGAMLAEGEQAPTVVTEQKGSK